ncbi:MAG: hypothetical protein JNK08_00365 [Sediminibacterium sp.]|nr:hypothetical protein [Sediminibacterium sp.]
MDGLKEVVEKISSYSIFNYLLPGTLFCFILRDLIGYNLIQDNILIAAFLYYFIGLVVSRVGSVIIEPFLKKVKFVKFAGYKEYVAATKVDGKIDLLSEVNNTYRSILSMVTLLCLSKLYMSIKFWLKISHDTTQLLLAIGLLILFLFSYRKQTNYISKRVKANT